MNPVHLAFVAMIALIFLGPKKLPELARSIGSGMREFRDTMSLDHEHERVEDAPHLPAGAVTAHEPAPATATPEPVRAPAGAQAPVTAPAPASPPPGASPGPVAPGT